MVPTGNDVIGAMASPHHELCRAHVVKARLIGVSVPGHVTQWAFVARARIQEDPVHGGHPPTCRSTAYYLPILGRIWALRPPVDGGVSRKRVGGGGVLGQECSHCKTGSKPI